MDASVKTTSFHKAQYHTKLYSKVNIRKSLLIELAYTNSIKSLNADIHMKLYKVDFLKVMITHLCFIICLVMYI